MSLLSYVVNWEELKDILADKLTNVVVKDLTTLYGIQTVKGFYKKIPAIKGSYEILTFRKNANLVITGVTYSQSAWKSDDYWELYIGEDKLFDTVFTKEVATHKNWKIIQPVNRDTEIKLILYNKSGNSRDVWVDLEFVEIRDTIGS